MAQRVVRVTAGSRLHFGMLSFGQPRARQFGGAGVMISAPVTRLAIIESDADTWRAATQGGGTGSMPAALCPNVSGPMADRVAEFVTRLSRQAAWWRPAPFQIVVEAVPPAHAGLGSGTQLGMALAMGLAAWCDAPPQSAAALAQEVGRGRRSAVGVHGASLGGLIVEGGKLHDAEISPLVSRIALPDNWRFLLILADHSEGLCGEAEQQAFARLPPVPAEVTAALCRELVCELAPAAARGDFERFSESLYRYGRLAGECFAARQGGAYASPEIEQFVMRCRDLGARGVGQSSWGPTVFALCRDDAQAAALSANLAAAGELRQRTALIAMPDNCGIKVEVTQNPTSSGHE